MHLCSELFREESYYERMTWDGLCSVPAKRIMKFSGEGVKRETPRVGAGLDRDAIIARRYLKLQ